MKFSEDITLNTATSIQSPKLRYDEFDAFRLFAAICVVVIHVSASAMTKFQTGSSLQLITTLINGIALFAVPGFIAISGLTIQLSYQSRSLVIGTFFKKRILTLALPYMIWTLIYYLDQLYFSNAVFSVTEYLKHLFWGTAFYHLYFMPIIFQFYLLYPLFHWLLKRINPMIFMSLTIILFVFYLGSSFTLFAQIDMPWPIKPEIPYSDRFFMSYLPFYALGLIMGQYYPWVLNHLKMITFVTLPFYFLSEMSHLLGRINYFVYQKNSTWQLPLAWELSSFCAIILLISLFSWFRRNGWMSPQINKLSALTFTLYLSHPLILQLCELKLGVIANLSLSFYYILALTLSIVIPLLLASGFDRIKKSYT